MAWGISFLFLFLFVAFNLVSAKIVLEDGYEVTTVVDGHKSGLNPHTIHALPGSSNLIILDYSASTFYTTSFPLSVDSVINRFAGDGIPGHVDGKAGNSRFSKPRCFTVDAKGNVYVADKSNKAIRKISSSVNRLISSMVSGLFFMCQRNSVAILDVSFSDPDSPSCSNPKPPLSLKPSDDLVDLISFDDTQEPNNDKECSNEETDAALSPPRATIDDIIKVQVEGFSKMAEENAAARGSSSAE